MPNENQFSLINLPEIPDSVDNALQNLTDAPTKNAGQTFGDIWYLVFGGISHAADKKRMKYAHDLENYKKELNNAIEQIPEEKRIEPSIQITAQALENSKYCVSSDELRKMFVNLISGTMNSDFEKDTHPSFPEILKQMSTIDALVIKEFSFSNRRAIANFRTKLDQGGSIPFLQYVYLGDLKYSISEYTASISSLERLGLLRVRFGEYFSNDDLYTPFLNTTEYHLLEARSEKPPYSGSPDLEKGICELTPLGKQFLNVCSPVPTISVQIV